MPSVDLIQTVFQAAPDAVPLVSAIQRVVIACLVILLAGWGGHVWIRRSDPDKTARGAAVLSALMHRDSGGGGDIQVLASKRIGRGVSVMSVRWNSRDYLLGCSPQSVTLLAEKAYEDLAA